MQLDFTEQKTEGRFVMYCHSEALKGDGIRESLNTYNTFVWNKGEEQTVWIDEIPYTFPEQAILPLMGNQHFRFEHPPQLVAWKFNREFYCILDHDQEVGCVGFLFYGIRTPFFITLNAKEAENFEKLQSTLVDEFGERDRFKGEMLRSLLKRLIIKTTRLGKSQTESCHDLADHKLDLIRRFALLVELHFRQQHEVRFYAESLNKSAKTLSNLFALYGQPSPSKIIHDRIVLEARRLFLYTDKSAKEVSFELGFANPEYFSRFFKSKTGNSITVFKSRK
ncbi:AraC family transcriptional regulator [Sinomicrobium soli]|nr:AraC family transcriptional regulator [Sinomicrobium sp. N-1-3-6]